MAAFDANFGATAGGNVFWQLVGMAVTVVIMAFGIGRGIEKANKVMTPLFYLLFIGLAVYLVTLPGAAEGSRYIFVLKPEGLLDPMVWVFALGQAFFSLSIAGNGTLIYGSTWAGTPMYRPTPRWSPCLTLWPPCWPPWSSSPLWRWPGNS